MTVSDRDAPAGGGILFEDGQSYTIRLEGFEGPLDLLLHLIRKNRFDIYNIPIASILKEYLGVLEVMRDFHNQVEARANGDREHVTTCICRWPEQAWRLALVLHAAAHGSRAHQHELAVTTARNAIRLARWFGDQQLQILNATTLQRQKQRMHKLLRNLQDSTEGEVTFRDLRNSHGFSTAEVEELVEAFPDRFRVEVNQNPNGGPKSRRLGLADK